METKTIQLFYKKNDEFDYHGQKEWGGQVWTCLYTLDMDATMRANDGNISLDNINDDVIIYTDDITEEELARLADYGMDYSRLSWDDYDYYCYAGDIEDWAGSSVIPCAMNENNVIIDVTVDDCGKIIGV